MKKFCAFLLVFLAFHAVANYFRKGMNIKSVLVKDATGGQLEAGRSFLSDN